MTADDDIERLRRIAYGPGATAEERAAAETELRQLRRGGPAATPVSDDTPSVDPEPLDDAQADEGEPPGSPAESEPPVEVALWRRSIRVGWLVPIVVGSLLLGVLGALGVTGQFDRFGIPGVPDPLSTPQGGRIAGDLEAADVWFNTPASNSVEFPFPDLLASHGIDPVDVRIALDAGDGFHVWVGRTSTSLCLLITDLAKSHSAVSCFERDRFAAAGAHLAMDGRQVDWYGHEVVVDPSDPAATATVPEAPGSGPGDVDAANEWFGTPATSSDAFPDDALLESMGVSQSDVRNLGLGDSAPHQLWLIKQGSKGFCLAIAEETSSRSKCATIAEFTTSGLTISEAGFAAYWNGQSVATSE